MKYGVLQAQRLDRLIMRSLLIRLVLFYNRYDTFVNDTNVQ